VCPRRLRRRPAPEPRAMTNRPIRSVVGMSVVVGLGACTALAGLPDLGPAPEDAASGETATTSLSRSESGSASGSSGVTSSRGTSTSGSSSGVGPHGDAGHDAGRDTGGESGPPRECSTIANCPGQVCCIRAVDVSHTAGTCESAGDCRAAAATAQLCLAGVSGGIEGCGSYTCEAEVCAGMTLDVCSWTTVCVVVIGTGAGASSSSSSSASGTGP
jgi:hypothetical protein